MLNAAALLHAAAALLLPASCMPSPPIILSSRHVYGSGMVKLKPETETETETELKLRMKSYVLLLQKAIHSRITFRNMTVDPGRERLHFLYDENTSVYTLPVIVKELRTNKLYVGRRT